MEKNIKTFYKDSGIKYDIDTAEINNDIKDYNNEIISKYNFSQKYNTFINNFNKFERTRGKKKRGAMSFKQNVIKIWKRIKKSYRKDIFYSFRVSIGRRTKNINTTTNVYSIANTFSTNKGRNNSQKLKNEIRQLLYSLYR